MWFGWKSNIVDVGDVTGARGMELNAGLADASKGTLAIRISTLRLIL